MATERRTTGKWLPCRHRTCDLAAARHSALTTPGVPNTLEDTMTVATHQPEAVAEEPLELLRNMLEEQFAMHTARLTQLTVYGRLPDYGGYDQPTLEALAAASRQDISDAARALQRMAEGTYGLCENCRQPIPLGRLRAAPDARYCTRCRPPSGSFRDEQAFSATNRNRAAAPSPRG
jgi:DnaK suppressor protein